MKKIMIWLLAAVLTLSAVPCALGETSVTIVVWSFTYELQGMIETYYAPNHPEINFEFCIYPTDGGTYENMLDNMASSDPTGDDAPDVFTMEAAFLKKYTDSDLTADMKTVGFTDEELNKVYPAVRDSARDNATQAVKGLSWQTTPGALFYRASLAEKYLGVTTPEEFEVLVQDWDGFLETAEQLKTASEGACKMITGTGELWNAYQYTRTGGWTENDQLYVDDEILDYLELCKTMTVDGLTQNGGMWSETWFAGMRGETETMVYLLPTWGLNYTLKPNCSTEWDYGKTEEENAAVCSENGTYGDWRMVTGPVGYNWGGTWIGANAAKFDTASAEKKAAIKDLIAFFSISEDFQLQYMQNSGDFGSARAAVQQMAADDENASAFLGGQNPYAVFMDSAELTDATTLSSYDDTINSILQRYVNSYVVGDLDADAAIQGFTEDVIDTYPELAEPAEPLEPAELTLTMGGYEDVFLQTDVSHYYVMWAGDTADLTCTLQAANGQEIAVILSDDAMIHAGNGQVEALQSGIATVTVALRKNGGTLQSVSASILVLSPDTTIRLPAGVTRLDSQALQGMAAECVIVPASVTEMGGGCFADCPNLRCVLFLDRPSAITAPSGTVGGSVLCLSAYGDRPANMSDADVGFTNYGE